MQLIKGGYAGRVHLQTKAFLFTRSALCAERPRSRGGFLRIKLVARFDLGVTVVWTEVVVLGEVAVGVVCANGIDLLSSPDLADGVAQGVTADSMNNKQDNIG